MKKYVIWIDQKKAIVGYFDAEGKYENTTIRSGIETRIRFPGESTNKIRLNTSKRTRKTSEKRKLEHQVVEYCKKLIPLITDAESILIIGPSGTKLILHKTLKNDPYLSSVPMRMRNADKFTLAEIRQTAARFYRISLRKPTVRRRV